MKVSTLILELQKFLETEGDLDVKLLVNSESHINAFQVELAYTEDKSSWMCAAIHPDDVEEGHDKICEIG